mgnify:CR=1 FL=1
MFYYLLFTGSVPYSLCGISSLTIIIVASTGNPGLTCSARCLSSVATHNLPSTYCLGGMDMALCGIVAATNVASQYTGWSCETDGLVSSDPCVAPWWSGVTCTSGAINSIWLSHSLTGT